MDLHEEYLKYFAESPSTRIDPEEDVDPNDGEDTESEDEDDDEDVDEGDEPTDDTTAE